MLIQLTMSTGRTTIVEHPTGEDDQDDVAQVTEVTQPVVIDAEQVRDFYPRKQGRVGTRILFRNGSALAVTDSFDEVKSKVRAAGLSILD